MVESYNEETLDGDKKRIVLKLKPHLAPIKVAIIPLARNNPDIVEKAKAIKQQIQSLAMGRIAYEDSGNIRKSYRRHDVIGTPLCITVDFDTIGKSDDQSLHNTVTIRDRDTMQQHSIPINELNEYVRTYLLKG